MHKKAILLTYQFGLLWLRLQPAIAANYAPPPASAQAIPAITPRPSQASIDEAVAYILTHFHYSREPLDVSLSGKIFDQYLKELDPNRIYFLKSDIDAFAQYRPEMAEYIRKGDLGPAFDVYRVFRRRFDERMAYVMGLLKNEPDFKKNEILVIEHGDAPWMDSGTELDDQWRKRIKNETIDFLLDGKTWPEAAQLLQHRYRDYASTIDRLGSDDVFDSIMNAYAKALDPHTEYFPPAEYEEFKTQMSLKLEGIGVQLQTDDDYVKILRILPGSPAAASGAVHPGDRIVAVGQGENGEFVDVVGWRLDDVVHLTRGPKGSILRLRLLPAGATPGTTPNSLQLVRDAIKLSEQAAHSEVLKLNHGGETLSIGIIRIPEFYSDFDGHAEGDANYNSVTRDVQNLLVDLEARHVDGVIVDIRNNGGGSLQEAADLAGLFLPAGPMVQLRSSTNRIDVVKSSGAPIYTGPLAVLVDRLSASASEIFAAAIQDYHRGVVIGNETYGKGVATRFEDIRQFFPDQDDAGQLMYVSEKFYRVTGASTQDRGVTPDIQMVSPIDPKQFGEETEDNALPWDTIDPVPYSPVDDRLPAVLPELRKRHAERVKSDPLYELYLDDIHHAQDADAVSSLSLVLDIRKRDEKREQAWRSSNDLAWQRITGKPLMTQAADGDTTAIQDVVLDETANIVADIHDLLRG
jgi:carboxyl-terminal processing protease